MNNPISTAPFLQGNASLAQGEGTGNPFQIDNSTLVQLQGVAKDYVDKKQAVYDEYKNNFVEGMATFNQSANFRGEEAKMLREKEARLIDFYKENPEMLGAPEKYPELLAQRNAMLAQYARDVSKVKELYAIDGSLQKSMENNAVDRGELAKDIAYWKTLPFEERLAKPPLPLTNIDASITGDDWAKATKFAISDSEVFTETLTNDKGQIVTKMWKKVDNDKINNTIGKEFDYTLQKKYETAKKENPNLDFNAFRADFFNQRNPIKMTTLDGKDGLWVLDETKIDVNEDQKNKYEMQKQNDAQAHAKEMVAVNEASDIRKYNATVGARPDPTTPPTEQIETSIWGNLNNTYGGKYKNGWKKLDSEDITRFRNANKELGGVGFEGDVYGNFDINGNLISISDMAKGEGNKLSEIGINELERKMILKNTGQKEIGLMSGSKNKKGSLGKADEKAKSIQDVRAKYLGK